MDFKAADVVFCKIDEVTRFFERLRLTRKKIILVTGEGDLPCDAFRQSFLPPNVVHWFATNVTCSHPRVTALPLGLGSPSCPTTLTGGELTALRELGHRKDGWLYVNFRAETNPRERLIPSEHFQQIAQSSTWVTFENPTQRGENAGYLRQLARHRFILCPPGNGVDTHRMWEAILAAAIPVVKRSEAMEPFRKLPILFVDDFRDVTVELLEKAHHEIRGGVHPEVMTTESYWAESIRAKHAEIHGDGFISRRDWIAESARYGVGMLARRIGFRLRKE